MQLGNLQLAHADHARGEGGAERMKGVGRQARRRARKRASPKRGWRQWSGGVQGVFGPDRQTGHGPSLAFGKGRKTGAEPRSHHPRTCGRAGAPSAMNQEGARWAPAAGDAVNSLWAAEGGR